MAYFSHNSVNMTAPTTKDTVVYWEITKQDPIKNVYEQILAMERRLLERLKSIEIIFDIFSPEIMQSRRELIEKCVYIMFQDEDYGPKVRLILWRIGYHKIISMAKMFYYNEMKKNKGNHNKETSSVRFNNELRSFLIYAIKDLQYLILKFENKFSISLKYIIDDYAILKNPIINPTIKYTSEAIFYEAYDEHDNYNYIDNPKYALLMIHSLLISLGDLHRYTIEFHFNDTNNKINNKLVNLENYINLNFINPEYTIKIYFTAFKINPENGMSQNQMATLLNDKNKGINSIFHYLFALSCTEPFIASEQNINGIFSNNSISITLNNNSFTEDDAPQLSSTTTSNRHPDGASPSYNLSELTLNDFLMKFILIIDIIYNKKEVDNFHYLCNEFFFNFKEFLRRKELNENLLFKMMSILLLCMLRSESMISSLNALMVGFCSHMIDSCNDNFSKYLVEHNDENNKFIKLYNRAYDDFDHKTKIMRTESRHNVGNYTNNNISNGSDTTHYDGIKILSSPNYHQQQERQHQPTSSSTPSIVHHQNQIGVENNNNYIQGINESKRSAGGGVANIPVMNGYISGASSSPTGQHTIPPTNTTTVEMEKTANKLNKKKTSKRRRRRLASSSYSDDELQFFDSNHNNYGNGDDNYVDLLENNYIDDDFDMNSDFSSDNESYCSDSTSSSDNEIENETNDTKINMVDKNNIDNETNDEHILSSSTKTNESMQQPIISMNNIYEHIKSNDNITKPSNIEYGNDKTANKLYYNENGENSSGGSGADIVIEEESIINTVLIRHSQLFEIEKSQQPLQQQYENVDVDEQNHADVEKINLNDKKNDLDGNYNYKDKINENPLIKFRFKKRYCKTDPNIIINFAKQEPTLMSLKIIFDWLKLNGDVLVNCYATNPELIHKIIKLINNFNIDIFSRRIYFERTMLTVDDLRIDLESLYDQNMEIPITEDIYLKALPILKTSQLPYDWAKPLKLKLTKNEETFLRIIKLVDFGFYLTQTKKYDYNFCFCTRNFMLMDDIRNFRISERNSKRKNNFHNNKYNGGNDNRRRGNIYSSNNRNNRRYKNNVNNDNGSSNGCYENYESNYRNHRDHRDRRDRQRNEKKNNDNNKYRGYADGKYIRNYADHQRHQEEQKLLLTNELREESGEQTKKENAKNTEHSIRRGYLKHRNYVKNAALAAAASNTSVGTSGDNTTTTNSITDSNNTAISITTLNSTDSTQLLKTYSPSIDITQLTTNFSPYLSLSSNSSNSSSVDVKDNSVKQENKHELMGKLWLRNEVKTLESKVKMQPSHNVHLTPYIVLDSESLTKFISLVFILIEQKNFIILIPQAVLSELDELKKTDAENVRFAVRFLENEFSRGNRFLRAQRSHETHPLPYFKVPKKMDREATTYLQIAQFCYYLIKNEGDYDVLTLLTGDDLSKKQSPKFSYTGIMDSICVKYEKISTFYDKYKDV